jgi:HAD superfamily hydrolase (TIGR01662 family)
MGKKLLSKVKAFGFDVDGTLYHSPPEMSAQIGREVIKKASGMLGMDNNDFADGYVKRRDELRSNTLTLNSFGLDGEKVFQQMWDEFPIEKYVKEDKRLADGLKQLAKRYRLFILSNGTERQIRRKLKYLGVEIELFDPLIACYDHGWVKPEPAPFLHALEQLEMRPEEVAYVGDRADVDVGAAKAVGIRAVLVGGEVENADISIESIHELFEIV